MSIRLPKVSIKIISANQVIENVSQKILFVGQMTSAGTATSGQLYQNIPNDNSQDTLFGKNSMLANAIRQAKQINKISQIDAIPLEDNVSGVKAIGKIDFSSATIAGTITIYIESPIYHKYILNVSATSTATELGDALVTAITADTTCPVSAVNVSGLVTLTAINAGTVGNFIGIQTIIIDTDATADVTAMAGGATDPVLTGLFDVIGDTRYQTIVYPSNYDIQPLTNLLDNRFNVDNNILDGVGILTKVDTVSNLISYGNSLNDQNIIIIGNKAFTPITNDSSSAIFESPLNISSQFAAIRALRLTDGADISKYVISSFGSRDTTGGIAIASLPYFNTPFSNLNIVPIDKDFTDIEINNLLDSGISVLGNNQTRTSIIAGQIVTTYKTDSASNPDITFKYLEYVDTEVNIREFFYNNLRSIYAQSRLTNGDVQPNRNMANASTIAATIDGIYVQLGSSDFVLTRIGIDPSTGINFTTFFKQNRTVTLNLENGSVNVTMQVPIVTQLREIIIDMQVNFSTTQSSGV